MMILYNPGESITCPKCERTYKAEVMGVEFIKIYETEDNWIEYLRLSCLCTFTFERRPLDYDGPVEIKNVP